MKRIVSVILAVMLVFPSLFASAATLPRNEDLFTMLDVMGIMTYDANGSFNEGSPVNRAALAKILVTASPYKGYATTTSRVSPFADVSFKHWGASYVSIASKNKFMTGYSDGTFRPDRTVLLEEAVSAMLRLLGYSNTDYTGAYPQGPLMKAEDIGLLENTTSSLGASLTRREMSILVYNLLNTPKKGESTVYAQSLGYKPSSEVLTLGDVIDENVTGPVTATPGKVNSLGISNPKVYRNGSSATLSDIENYDVIYYSTKSRVIWAYSKKISGVLGAVSPNKEAPTSVTVSGVSYPLNYYSVQKAFGLDGLNVGETVTMLLDKNGAVCDAYLTSAMYEDAIGVVISLSPKTITNADGSSKSEYYATVLMLDGSTVDVKQPSSATGLIGKACEIDYATSSLKSIRDSASGSATGIVNASNYMWGSTPISSDVKILEVDDNGNTISLSLSRLDGVSLKSSSILLSSRNSAGAIDGLIIKNVTGDTMKYGLVSEVERNYVQSSGGMAPSSYVYHYDIDGIAGSLRGNGITNSITEGPARFIYKNGVLDSIENLKQTDNISSINPSYVATQSGIKHKISANVLVYKLSGDEKIKTDLNEAISHDGKVTAFYDKEQREGGLVRVIYLR